MDDIILHKTIVSGNRVTFYFETRGLLSDYFTTDQFFVEYNKSMEDVPISVLNIIFVSSILPLMWLTDTTMWVYELDRTFYDSILRLKHAYQELYADYPLKGRFVSARLQQNCYKIKRESLLLFSGGIDAHVSYLRIKETHPILCNVQGWYTGEDEEKLVAAEADFRDISAFSKKEGIEFEFVKSNFAVLVNNKMFHKNIEKKLGDSWWHGFQHSMSFISIAIPLAYLHGVRNIYIGSSFSIGKPGKCASYATTDIEFRFAEMGGCVHDAFDLSRQDKVRFLVQYQKNSGKAYPVRVCSFRDHNCCECEKCFRTVLEIVAEGGEVRDFGFSIQGPLKQYWNKVMDQRLWNFDVRGESTKHWPDSIQRIKENYNGICDKEFVDWFLNYDFSGTRKKAVRQYRRKNFFKILKRKMQEHNGI